MIVGSIVGRLGKDADADDDKCKFSLATNARTKDKQTIWVSCTIWGKPGSVTKFLTKGTQVFVSGQLIPWESERGHGLSLTVETLELLGSKPKSADVDSEPASSAPPDDDIPF